MPLRLDDICSFAASMHMIRLCLYIITSQAGVPIQITCRYYTSVRPRPSLTSFVTGRRAAVQVPEVGNHPAAGLHHRAAGRSGRPGGR